LRRKPVVGVFDWFAVHLVTDHELVSVFGLERFGKRIPKEDDLQQFF